MSALKVIGAGLGLVLLAGAANGGVVHRQDGSIDPSASLQQSANLGGNILGDSLDNATESLGRGFGSTLSSSKVAKAAVVGGAAYGAIKYGPKLKNQYSVCWQRKSCDASPIQGGNDDPLTGLAPAVGLLGE